MWRYCHVRRRQLAICIVDAREILIGHSPCGLLSWPPPEGDSPVGPGRFWAGPSPLWKHRKRLRQCVRHIDERLCSPLYLLHLFFLSTNGQIKISHLASSPSSSCCCFSCPCRPAALRVSPPLQGWVAKCSPSGACHPSAAGRSRLRYLQVNCRRTNYIGSPAGKLAPHVKINHSQLMVHLQTDESCLVICCYLIFE